MSKPKVKADSIIEDSRWLELEFPVRDLTLQLAEIVLEKLDFFEHATHANFSIKYTNDEDIKKLNSTFREKNTQTNVLSFPHLNLKEADFKLHKLTKNIYLGDIAISYESVLKEITEQGKTFKDHFSHLIVHSLLHLLGFDHITEEEAIRMEMLEIEILKDLNIKNPYIIEEINEH